MKEYNNRHDKPLVNPPITLGEYEANRGNPKYDHIARIEAYRKRTGCSTVRAIQDVANDLDYDWDLVTGSTCNDGWISSEEDKS